MAKASFNITLKEDRRSVLLEMLIDDKAVGWADVEAPELEGFIELLWRTRMEMSDEVPRDLDVGSRVIAVADPIWRIPNYREPQGRPLFLRHPGIGWMSFVFPDEEAKSVAEWLTKALPTKEPKAGA
jgi:hypothetical protein